MIEKALASIRRRVAQEADPFAGGIPSAFVAPTQTLTWFVVVDRAQHAGAVACYDESDMWSHVNENGWTMQDVCVSTMGTHGQILGRFASKDAAESALRGYLKCDNDRCYSHGSRRY